MSESPITQTDDNSQKADGAGAANVKIDLHMPKESPWRQPAVYVAILALLVSLGGYAKKAEDISELKADNRAYRNDISMWETDNYNILKSLRADLEAHGYKTSRLDKLTPPPER